MTPNERESGDKSQHSKCVSRLEFNAVNERAIESGDDKAGTCDYVAM